MTSISRTRPSSPAAAASRPSSTSCSSSGLKFTWAGTMRADQGVRLSPELWGRAAQSGLRRLLVGVESGSDEMLRRIRKDIRIEQVFETAAQMVEPRHRRALPLHRRLSGGKRREHPGHARLAPSACAQSAPSSRRRSSTSSPTRAVRSSSRRSHAASACRPRSRRGRGSTTWPASRGHGCRARSSS